MSYRGCYYCLAADNMCPDHHCGLAVFSEPDPSPNGSKTGFTMMETMELGPTPCEESCAQVGSADYSERGPIECQVYRRQLVRLYKAEHGGNDLPAGCTLKTSTHFHDFGSYHEVAARYNIEDETATEAAFWLEANLPAHWDDEANMELQELIPAHNMLPSPNG